MMAHKTEVRARDAALMAKIAEGWLALLRVRAAEVAGAVSRGYCDDEALALLNEACEQLTIAAEWLPVEKKGGRA